MLSKCVCAVEINFLLFLHEPEFATCLLLKKETLIKPSSSKHLKHLSSVVFTIVSQLYCGDDDKSIVLNALNPSGTIVESFIAHHSNEKRPSGDIEIRRVTRRGIWELTIKCSVEVIGIMLIVSLSNNYGTVQTPEQVDHIPERSLPSSLTMHYKFIKLLRAEKLNNTSLGSNGASR
uniref:Uncharacterized protein n=1 Tax=Glossina pallidipes TaxID=7398 RepID=A0A1A9ZVP9_GLOPL